MSITNCPATVFITNNETGETREYRDDLFWYEDGFCCAWSEGNYACDCNRAMFFAEVKGETDPEVECGEERYTVTHAMTDDGVRVEIDEGGRERG